MLCTLSNCCDSRTCLMGSVCQAGRGVPSGSFAKQTMPKLCRFKPLVLLHLQCERCCLLHSALAPLPSTPQDEVVLTRGPCVVFMIETFF